MHDEFCRGLVTDGGDGFVSECGSDESIVQAVLRSLATACGVPQTELEPLYENIDPDALEAIVRHSDRTTNYVAIEFTMEGYTVVVRGDGTIRIDPAPPRTARDCKDEEERA